MSIDSIRRAVVVSCDGLSVTGLGAYGDEWVATPRLNGLCAEGVVFDWHFADHPDSAAARRSWRTGRYQLGPLAAGFEPDLLASLRAAGVFTVLIRDLKSEPHPAFAEGWDEVHNVENPDDLIPTLESVAGTFRDAERGLLWVETDRLLPPWEVPEEMFERYFDVPPEELEGGDVGPWPDPPAGPIDREDLLAWDRLHASRAAAISAFDAECGLMLDWFRGSGLDQDSLWALTGSCGYALGEEGFVGPHRRTVHEAVVHVPLIVRLPGSAEAGRRIAALTQSVDLWPTLADALGVGVPEVVHGRSLLPFTRGGGEGRGFAVFGTPEERGVRTPGWVLRSAAEGGEPRLFEKPDDRWEVNDLRQHHLEYADALREWLSGFAEAAGRTGPLEVADPPTPGEAD